MEQNKITDQALPREQAVILCTLTATSCASPAKDDQRGEKRRADEDVDGEPASKRWREKAAETAERDMAKALATQRELKRKLEIMHTRILPHVASRNIEGVVCDLCGYMCFKRHAVVCKCGCIRLCDLCWQRNADVPNTINDSDKKLHGLDVCYENHEMATAGQIAAKARRMKDVLEQEPDPEPEFPCSSCRRATLITSMRVCGCGRTNLCHSCWTTHDVDHNGGQGIDKRTDSIMDSKHLIQKDINHMHVVFVRYVGMLTTYAMEVSLAELEKLFDA
jgi:hypothetical protein